MSDTERLTIQQLVQVLRGLKQHIPDFTQLTIPQAQRLRAVTQVSEEFILHSVSALGASPMIVSAVGATSAEAQRERAEDNEWTAVETEIMVLLAGVRGAKLVRRHRIARRALQTYRLAEQLSKLDAHRYLLPMVEDMRSQMNLGRKKARKVAETADVVNKL